MKSPVLLHYEPSRLDAITGNFFSIKKDTAKEPSLKDDAVDATDHLARLFANAKKMPASGEKKPPPAKFEKASGKFRRDRGKPKGESAAGTNVEGLFILL